MRLNITSQYIPLDDFKAILDTTTNLNDLHFLCHQAGCPVYVVRDNYGKCYIMWHPSIDQEKDVINISITNGVLSFEFEGIAQPFEELEELKKGLMARSMLGDNPFDPNYLVWSKDIKSEVVL